MNKKYRMGDRRGNRLGTGYGRGVLPSEYRRSKRGKFELSFVETYKGLSDTELGLVDKYGLDMIALSMPADKKYMSLELDKEKAGVGYTADTYYVRYMDKVIGILTIRVDTYLKDVTFIYKERARKGRK